MGVGILPVGSSQIGYTEQYKLNFLNCDVQGLTAAVHHFAKTAL